MKVCIKCNVEKQLSDYYKHTGMKDGRLNKCKECVKAYSLKRYEEQSNDDEWMDKERERTRKKYHRLKYKGLYYPDADDKKKAQLLLYKEFFSRQFNIPLDKIKVEYFIVKRQVPKDAEFASMQKRVQEFRPADGPRKMKQAVALMENFVSQAVGMDGKYIEKEYPTSPSEDTCKFCPIKELRLCSDAAL